MEPGTRGVSLHRAKWRRGSEVERLCGASALWEPSEFVLPEEMLGGDCEGVLVMEAL